MSTRTCSILIRASTKMTDLISPTPVPPKTEVSTERFYRLTPLGIVPHISLMQRSCSWLYFKQWQNFTVLSAELCFNEAKRKETVWLRALSVPDRKFQRKIEIDGFMWREGQHIPVGRPKTNHMNNNVTSHCFITAETTAQTFLNANIRPEKNGTFILHFTPPNISSLLKSGIA